MQIEHKISVEKETEKQDYSLSMHKNSVKSIQQKMAVIIKCERVPPAGTSNRKSEQEWEGEIALLLCKSGRNRNVVFQVGNRHTMYVRQLFRQLRCVWQISAC